MSYIPDNESIGQYILNERDRLERLYERFESEENIESEEYEYGE
jgi:hypothetical protein